jgi:hypothetical protein
MALTSLADLASLRDELIRDEAPARAATPTRRPSARVTSMAPSQDELYMAAKAQVATGRLDSARACASAASKGADRRIRYLADQRLKLLASRPPVPSSWQVDGAPAGIAWTELFGRVPVLGKYETVGRETRLTGVIRQFKKAPEEANPDFLSIRPEVVNRLGYALSDLMRGMDLLGADLIVPAPVDPVRFSVRCFSASAELAMSASRHSLVPSHPGIVRKIRETRSLRTLRGSHERKLELAGSMAVSQERSYLVSDACVVLVDDVVTFGTTFREMSGLLLRAGARCVHGLAVAAAHGQVRPTAVFSPHGVAA